MIYTVTLNPSVDYYVTVKDFKSGSINRTNGEYILPGGKGVNVSLVLKNLGFDSIATGFVAGSTGALFSSLLCSEGIKAEFVELSSGSTRINVKVKSSSETEINASGPAVDDKAYSQLLKKLSALSMSDTAVVAGSVPASVGEKRYCEMLECISKSGARLIVDTTGTYLTLSLKYKPFLIKPNHIELGEIFETSCNNEQIITECAKRLQQAGAQNVLVSRGGDGAILFDSLGNTHVCAAPGGEVVSTVGSGDSTVAGFIAGYEQTNSYSHALRLGISAGSATAFTTGLASGESIKATYKMYLCI